MKEISIKDITIPPGDFESIYKRLREVTDEAITLCDTEQRYDKELARIIKLIVEFDLIGIWEEGIKKGECFEHLGDPVINLLYTHLLIIDLNNTAMKYLNHISMPPRHEQLQDMIDSKPKIFKKLKLKIVA